ncbi:hypothetical protein L3X38_018003 [Prunus dulcis]|uniref:Uncharacterized protein n=1 Tax=Prunus dulcis TaxID=3755 RepID=A0AAD4WAS9_PRUDU|nr:hypothetical protein L3X38_018003 [Prunus dulcis]
MPSQKGGRDVFLKGHGAFSKMQLRWFLQRPWCLLKNMVWYFPLQKWPGVSLQNWSNISFCKTGRALLKKVGRALLKYLGRLLLLQKIGPRWIFSLRTRVPSSQHLGKQSWAERVEVQREVFWPRKLKFGRSISAERIVRQEVCPPSSHYSNILRTQR